MRLQQALHTLLLALDDLERDASARELALPEDRELPGLEFAAIDADENRWRSLALYDVGQAFVRVQSSRENREHFAIVPPGKPEDKEVKLYAGVSALVGLRSRVMMRALVRPKDRPLSVAELDIPDSSLILFEGTEVEPELLLRLREGGTDRHFIAPAGTRKWRTAKVLDARTGDALVEMRVPPGVRGEFDLPPYVLVRAIEYSRHGYPRETILTSLTDTNDWPRHEISAIHSERFASLSNARASAAPARRAVLEAKNPPDALYAVWALLGAYNLVRMALFHCARELGQEPARMDFATAVAELGPDLLKRALAASDPDPLFQALRARAQDLVLADTGSPMRVTVDPIA